MSEFTDRAEYEKYRAEMLEKLRQSQESLAEKPPDVMEGTAGSPKTRAFRPGIVITIASLSCVAFGVAVIFLFMFVFNTPAHKGTRHRTSLTGEKYPAPSMLDRESGGNRGEEGEAAQSPPWSLGFRDGRAIAGAFLTNKQRLIREKCAQSMLKTGVRSEDYLRGCLEGYHSLVMVKGRPR